MSLFINSRSPWIANFLNLDVLVREHLNIAHDWIAFLHWNNVWMKYTETEWDLEKIKSAGLRLKGQR